MSESVVLQGMKGVFAAATCVLKRGQKVIVGRSRSCGFSACTTPKGQALGRSSLESSPAFLQISRRHFEVELTLDGTVKVTNLSSNGLVIGHERITEFQCELMHLRDQPLRIKFGAEEALEVRAADSEVVSLPK